MDIVKVLWQKLIKYSEEDYMKDLSNGKTEIVSKTISAAAIPEAMVLGAAVDIIKESIHCFNDYLKYCEHEKTERYRIAAQLKAINEIINARKEVSITALENKHKELTQLYQLGHEVIKLAMERGDIGIVQQVYSFLANVSRTSGQETTKIVEDFLQNNNSPMLLK